MMKKKIVGYDKLMGILRANNMTQKEYASIIGISDVSLYNRLCGKYPFTQSEIAATKEHFNLSPVDVDDIFFAN